MPPLTYVVCNRLLDPETYERCEYDGEQYVSVTGRWKCPSCHAVRVH